jgi:predicted PurR-regulated permease PerM
MNNSLSTGPQISVTGLLSGAWRVLVWGLFFCILYLLRSFFLLIFLTFVFSYIQARAVDRLEIRIRCRAIRVVLVALMFLAALVAVGAYIVPSVGEQAKLFAGNYTAYLRAMDENLFRLADRYPAARNLIPIDWAVLENRGSREWSSESSLSLQIFQQLFGLGERAAGNENFKSFVEGLRNIGGRLIAAASAFLLSLLFSFLIVLDLPRLIESVKDLRNTKLKAISAEVAGSIFNFGSVLGRALEAQFFIALLNTVLTALGLAILGLESKIAFLSMIVFLCSFIPIAGVFISSLPICLVALQSGGLGLMFLAVLIITMVHLVEAYILNPRIYGLHLHMNPVLVLIVLTLAGKLFGTWGLILALPACRYFFGQTIRETGS